MDLHKLTRIADHCLAIRDEVDPDTPHTLRVLLDMTLLEVGRQLAAHGPEAPVPPGARMPARETRAASR